MKLSDFSVNRSVTAIMIFVGLVVMGFVSYSKTPLDLFPDIEFPVAVVITDYPGTGPKEVESSVTRPLEEALAGINNVEKISSTSKEGSSMIMMQFVWGTDMTGAVSDVRERIDIYKQFLPDGVETPIVLKYDVSMMPIMVLAISGDRKSEVLRDYAENDLKNMIEKIDGVASANVFGGQVMEVKVELIKNRLDAYGVSVDNVIQMLRMENMNVSGGKILSPDKRYTLRTRGEFASLDDIRNVIVTVRNGTPIYLRDVASVYFGPEEVTDIVHLNGQNGIILRVNKQSDKNTVVVARNVLKELEDIQKAAPGGIEITPFFNQGEYIEQSINNVVNSAILGGVIAILVVFVFLKSFRSALILGLSIPLSIIATFIMMYYFDITLNMMSMGGLAIGVGMLIDNSIVILENIYRYREKGARPTEAAKLGADEMAMAITASTLTTICVFVPFFFTEGLAGQLFTQMALTISFSLICSLLVALTLVPMLSSKLIKDINVKPKSVFFQNMNARVDAFFGMLESYYSRGIRWALGNRLKVVGLTLASIVIGLMILPIAGMEFMPEQDNGQLVFRAKLPVGTNLQTTEQTVSLIEKKLQTVLKPEEYTVIRSQAGYGKGFAAAFGGNTDHSAQIEIRLTAISKRDRSLAEIRTAIRKELADVPGVELNYNVQTNNAMGGGAQISVEVYGYDFAESERFVEEIRNAIKDVPGVKDISISRESGLPEKVVVINREKASAMGLSVTQISSMIKNSVAGSVATTFRYEGEEYDTFVFMRESDRDTLEGIKSIMVATPSGEKVPLGNLIDVKNESGPASIERKKQQRVVYLNCKPEGRALNKIVEDIQDRIDGLVKPKNFFVNISGSFEDMQDSFKDLALALILAVVLIYIVMASQFESFFQPLVIMFSVPTLIFGVMFMLFLTGSTFNVISFMGILMLSGIVVNNAIVLVDYTDILRERGMNLHDALIEAGSKRLRPILMTTLTTILGLIPMAIGLGEGSEMTTPLAHAVIGGMSSSFLFTLFFVPVVYSIFESFKTRARLRRERRRQEKLMSGGYQS